MAHGRSCFRLRSCQFAAGRRSGDRRQVNTRVGNVRRSDGPLAQRWRRHTAHGCGATVTHATLGGAGTQAFVRPERPAQPTGSTITLTVHHDKAVAHPGNTPTTGSTATRAHRPTPERRRMAPTTSGGGLLPGWRCLQNGLQRLIQLQLHQRAAERSHSVSGERELHLDAHRTRYVYRQPVAARGKRQVPRGRRLLVRRRWHLQQYPPGEIQQNTCTETAGSGDKWEQTLITVPSPRPPASSTIPRPRSPSAGSSAATLVCRRRRTGACVTGRTDRLVRKGVVFPVPQRSDANDFLLGQVRERAAHSPTLSGTLTRGQLSTSSSPTHCRSTSRSRSTPTKTGNRALHFHGTVTFSRVQ